MSVSRQAREIIDHHPAARKLASRLKLRHYYAISQFLTGKSALHELGWFKSSKVNEAISNKGEPLPWLTYPVINFLAGRVSKRFSVFEFGSGNSTLWWAAHADHVIACEHDQSWYQTILQKLPDNAKVIFGRLANGEYANLINTIPELFDIVVIDGRDRVKCATNALARLTIGGVIIWDNTDRSRYKNGYKLLSKNGFRSIEFVGLSPIDNVINQTSVFYRDGNCLHI